MTFVSKAWLRHVDVKGFDKHAPYGEHHETGDILFVSNLLRREHTYIIGQSGYGKSGLAENLILYDIITGDCAVALFDFHGDLHDAVIAAVPTEHLHRIFSLDMLDVANPISLNLFTPDNAASGTTQRIAVNRILHLFTALWPEVERHAHLPSLVRAAAYTMLANEGTTLHDMYRMFNEPAYRKQLVANAPWQNIRDYWEQYDALSKEGKEGHSQAVVARLHQLFMGDPLMANILGQAPGKIDWRQIIANKQVILIKLPGRTMEYEARLVAGILLAQLQAAIFDGFDTAPEDRQPISVFLDEFQSYASPDLPVLLTEGRKLLVSMHLSHQIRSQVPKELRDAALGVSTIVCFRTQLDDSRELAPLFTNDQTYIKPEDITPHPIQHLLDYGSPEPSVQAFIDSYVRPLSQHRRGNWIELSNRGFSWTDMAIDVASGGSAPSSAIRLPDPLPWLDDLLRRVMETNNPDLPIPGDAVAGFANAGAGFFPQIRNRPDSDPMFQPGYNFPTTLVVEQDGVSTWVKRPENGKEQLLHCIFSIRSVMEYLAFYPIGTETKMTDHDTAQILRNLPKRAAAVKTGDEQGVIYTLDNPPHVTGAELQQRLTNVQTRTRDTFCRPREEVEAMHQKRPSMKQPAAPEMTWDKR